MRSKLLIASLALFSIGVTSALAHVPAPPKKGEGGRKTVRLFVEDFTLFDQDRRPFRLGSLRGKVVLATFVYTSCPDICPLFTAKFAAIQRELKSEGRSDYFLVSITTDPEIDTPKVLKSYGQRFEADFRTWAFLTGSKEDLEKAWQIFGVAVKKRGKGLIQHTGLTTLVDKNGMRRINYYGDAWTEKGALKDMIELATERR